MVFALAVVVALAAAGLQLLGELDEELGTGPRASGDTASTEDGPGPAPGPASSPSSEVDAFVDSLVLRKPGGRLAASTYGTQGMLAAEFYPADATPDDATVEFGIVLAGRPTAVFPLPDSFDVPGRASTLTDDLVDAAFLGGSTTASAAELQLTLPPGAIDGLVVISAASELGTELAGFGPLIGDTFGDDRSEVYQLIIEDYRQTWWVFELHAEPFVLVVELPLEPADDVLAAVEEQARLWGARLAEELGLDPASWEDVDVRGVPAL